MGEINKRTKQQWYIMYDSLRTENYELCSRYSDAKRELQAMTDDRNAFAKDAQDLRAENGRLDRALMRTEAARAQLEYMVMEALKK